MWNKLLILGVMLGLALSVGIVVSCGDDDDDDDDTIDDDDTGDDDNDTFELTCNDAWAYFYDDCGAFLTDENDDPIDVEDIIAWCVDGADFYGTDGYQCIYDLYGDCDAVIACINDLL